MNDPPVFHERGILNVMTLRVHLLFSQRIKKSRTLMGKCK